MLHKRVKQYILYTEHKPIILSFEDRDFYKEGHPQNCICKISDTLYGRIINAEFSLQRASHNSHENNQRQSWSQIRKL